jgi:hypothetical protein
MTIYKARIDPVDPVDPIPMVWMALSSLRWWAVPTLQFPAMVGSAHPTMLYRPNIANAP